MNINSLEKFEYNPDTFEGIKDELVTLDGRKVEILRVIQTSPTNKRLLGLIHEADETETVVTYTFEGNAQGTTSHDLDIYVDTSVTKWINIGIDENGKYTVSGPYENEIDAKESIKEGEFMSMDIKFPKFKHQLNLKAV